MNRTRQFLAVLAGGIGVSAALLAAPTAIAAPDGGGGPNNPLLPGCEVTGSGGFDGGETTDCASPGNSQITAYPNDLAGMGGEEGMWGFGGW